MSSSLPRDSSPAISDPFPSSPPRFFQLRERVTVFDDIDFERMRERPTHKIVVLEGQVSFFER